MMDFKFKSMITWGVVLVAALSLYLIFSPFQKSGLMPINPILNDEEIALRAGVVPTVNRTTGTSTATKKLNYQEAVATYKYRFQFVNCSGTPGSINVAAGGQIMLDNRDEVSRSIAVGDKSYTIAPLDYAVAIADKTGGYFVTCDGGGAARVFVY